MFYEWHQDNKRKIVGLFIQEVCTHKVTLTV